MSRRELVSKVKEFFSEKVLIFSSPGIASVVLFTAHATTVLSVVKDEEEDIDFSKLAKTIRKEVSDIPKQKAVYSKRIDYQTANLDVSPTVNTFLSAITPKFNHSLSGVLIGNIITSVLSSRATNLQVSLGLLANKKNLFNIFSIMVSAVLQMKFEGSRCLLLLKLRRNIVTKFPRQKVDLFKLSLTCSLSVSDLETQSSSKSSRFGSS